MNENLNNCNKCSAEPKYFWVATDTASHYIWCEKCSSVLSAAEHHTKHHAIEEWNKNNDSTDKT